MPCGAAAASSSGRISNTLLFEPAALRHSKLMTLLDDDVMLVSDFSLEIRNLGQRVVVGAFFAAVSRPCIVVFRLELRLAPGIFGILLVHFAVVLNNKVRRGADAEQNVACAGRSVGEGGGSRYEQSKHCG